MPCLCPSPLSSGASSIDIICVYWYSWNVVIFNETPSTATLYPIKRDCLPACLPALPANK